MELTADEAHLGVDAELCHALRQLHALPLPAPSRSTRDARPASSTPTRCIGCSICAQKCFAGALAMRERTPAELAALRED